MEPYLRSLRIALGDRLPPAVTTARLREARSHLEMAAEELGESEAIRRFGPARRVANALVRTDRGYDTRSVTKLSIGIGIVMFASIAGPYGWLYLLAHQNRDVSPAASLTTMAVVLAFIGFAFRVFSTRRWLVLPTTAWCAAAFLFALIFQLTLTPEAPQMSPQEAIADAQNRLRVWRNFDEGVSLWKRGGAIERWRPAPSYLARSSGSFAPFGYGIGKPDGTTFPGPRDGIAEWNRYGHRWEQAVSIEIRLSQNQLALIRQITAEPQPSLFENVLSCAATGTAVCFTYLLGLNALALGFGALHDRRQVRHA